MDKETLSNYGWIVICVLVIAVMVALATPFGNYVKSAVENTTQGMFDVEQKALVAGGLTIANQDFEGGSEPESPAEPEITTFEFSISGGGKHGEFNGDYTAENNMTWAGWINSEYNVDGFWIDEYNEISKIRFPSTYPDAEYMVFSFDPTDSISATNYYFEDMRVGG